MTSKNQARPIKKRRPWFAAFLSLICPGLGQIYNTQIRFGFRLYALSVSLAISAGIVMTIPPKTLWIILIFILFGTTGLCVTIWAVVAAFTAARQSRDVKLTRYNRWFIYLALFAASAAVVETASAKWSPFMRWEAFNIPARSMIPNLLVGDHVISWRYAWRDRTPERGELAIFNLPRDNETDYIKRIIGLPGDIIQMRKGRLVLNGTEVRRDPKEDYQGVSGAIAKQYIETLPNGRAYEILEAHGDNGSLDNTDVYRIPAGYVFVMGDNRDNSLDSRVTREMSNRWIGSVPLENLYAKPTFIYWARDKSRIGLKLD